MRPSVRLKMNLSRHLIGIALAICSLIISALGVFVAAGFTWSDSLVGLIPFSIVLLITIVVGGCFSRYAVRFGGVSPKVAGTLPAIPFVFLTVWSFPALILGSVGPVLLWSIPLTLALLVGRRFAMSSAFQ